MKGDSSMVAATAAEESLREQDGSVVLQKQRKMQDHQSDNVTVQKEKEERGEQEKAMLSGAISPSPRSQQGKGLHL